MELESRFFSLPDSCTFDQASLAEPLSVVIHASRRCGLAPSQTVCVFGVGAIGLLACALAKHTGASKVCAIDINPVRLEFAMKHGFADAVYCLPSPSVPTPKSNGVSINGISKLSATAPATYSEEQIKRSRDAAIAALMAFDSKDGFDVVFECTGAENPIQMCIFVSIFVLLLGRSPGSVYNSLTKTHISPTDSNNWWTRHAYRNGYTRSPPPTFNSGSS
jgi:L-iditol 2-dehydrogenase